MSNSTVCTILYEHKTELTTDELQHVLEHKKQEAEDEKEAGKKCLPSEKIKKLFSHRKVVQAIVEEMFPNQAISDRCVDIFSDNVMSHYCHILLLSV